MMLDRLTLSAQRREVADLAKATAALRQDALTCSDRAWSRFESRFKQRSSLALAFVSGLTLAMVVPQGRRGQPAEKRRPISNNAALRQVSTWVRTYTLGRVLRALTNILDA